MKKRGFTLITNGIRKLRLFGMTAQPLRGFTLIELLIVISIIGVLAGLLLASYSTAQRQARNTQRRSDLKQYQTALENYGSKNNFLYPGRNTAGGVSATTTLCTDLGSANISGCPEDPRFDEDATFEYRYISDGDNSGGATALVWVLWGKIESDTGTRYWVVCSNGNSGEVSTAPTSSTCPL